MAKPRNPAVRRFVTKGPGAGAVEAEAVVAEAEEGVGKQGDEADPPP